MVKTVAGALLVLFLATLALNAQVTSNVLERVLNVRGEVQHRPRRAPQQPSH